MRVDTDKMPDIMSSTGKGIARTLKHHNFPTHRIAALFDVNQGRVSEAIGSFSIHSMQEGAPHYTYTPWGLFEDATGTFKAT